MKPPVPHREHPSTRYYEHPRDQRLLHGRASPSRRRGASTGVHPSRQHVATVRRERDAEASQKLAVARDPCLRGRSTCRSSERRRRSRPRRRGAREPSTCRYNVSSAGVSTGEPITWLRHSSRGDLRRHVVGPRDARLAAVAARVGRRVRPGPAHVDGACGPEPREPHTIDATSSLSRVSSTAWRRANLGAGRGGRCRATAPTPSRARAHARRTRLLRPWAARVFVDGFESGIVLDVSHGGSIARTLAGAAAGWPTALIAARVQVQVLRRSGSMAGVNRGAVIKGVRCRERVMQRCTLPGLCQQQQQVLHKSSAARAVPGSDSLQHERLRGASPLQ